MLSELNKFSIADTTGRKVKLADLAIKDSARVDYPPVYRLYYFNKDRKFASLRWSEVIEIKFKKRQFIVKSFNNEEIFSPGILAKEVLLLRDVQDAIIIDLQNRRTTRANDIWLEHESNELILRGADIGLRAVLRRLSRGILGKPRPQEMYDWRYVEFLRGNPEAVKNGAGYNLRITRLAPGEIAGLIEAIPYLHAAELIVLLPDDLASIVFEVTSLEKQLQIFEELDNKAQIKILGHISPEATAKILKQFDSNRTKKLLEGIPGQRSNKVIEILKYPEGTVGSIMTTDFVFAPKNLTVKEAREYLREQMLGPNFVYFIYIVNDILSRNLCGVISLRLMMTGNDEEKLSDLMDKYVSFLSPVDNAYSAAFRVIDSHLAAMPVIDNDSRLIGALTIDAAVSAVAPRSWRDQAPRVFS